MRVHTLDPSPFEESEGVHVLTSDHPMIWGDMSLEIVRWSVFRWILNNLNVDWVMLLSEQDYPITPLYSFRSRLAESEVDAIIYGERVDEIVDREHLDESTKRYMYQYKPLPSFKMEQRFPMRWRAIMSKGRPYLYAGIDHLQKKVAIYRFPPELALPSWIGVRPVASPFSSDFPCWRHRPWYAISRKAMEHVIDYVDSHPVDFRTFGRLVDV
jgi:hypothetical protein